jgi:hypothetical protein
MTSGGTIRSLAKLASSEVATRARTCPHPARRDSFKDWSSKTTGKGKIRYVILVGHALPFLSLVAPCEFYAVEEHQVV